MVAETRSQGRTNQAGRPAPIEQASKKEQKPPTPRQLRNQAKKQAELMELSGIFYILRITMALFFVLPAWVCKASIFFECRGWHHLAAHHEAGRRKVESLNASLGAGKGKRCCCKKGKCHLTKRLNNKPRRVCRAGERCPAQKRLGTDFCTTCASETKQGCERGYLSKKAASRCKKGIQGYNATKLRVCQGCSSRYYGLLLGTPLADAKKLLPGGEESTQLLAAKVNVTQYDPQQPPVYESLGRFRGPKDKSDPTEEAGNGRFICKEDMINHPNPSIQGTPGLVACLMDCVFMQQDVLPASGFCCVKVRREANGEVTMLEVQPTMAAVEEKHPLDPYEALVAGNEDEFPGLADFFEDWGVDFGEEGEATED